MAFKTLLFMVLQAYIMRKLLKPERIHLQDQQAMRKAFVGSLSYLVGVGAAWLSVPIAFLVYVLRPLFYITPPPGPPFRIR